MSEEKTKTKKSWKTTTAGVLAAIGILAAELNKVLDDNPETVISWEACLVALGALGFGWFARDKNVSSKASGVE